MALYYYDANVALVEPTPNIETETLQDALLKLLAQLKQKGPKDTNICLNNKVSDEHLNLLE